MFPESEKFYVFSCDVDYDLEGLIPKALAYATGISPDEPFDRENFKRDINKFMKDTGDDFNIMETFFHRISDGEGKSPFYNSTEIDQKVKLEIYIEGYDSEDLEGSTNYKDEPWNDRKEFKFILDRLESRLGPLQNKTMSEVVVVVSKTKLLELGDENE